MKCKVCGKEENISMFYPDTQKKLRQNGLCFSCQVWQERLPLVNNPEVAIIDGTFYTIGPEDDTPKQLRGFGGDKFVIRFKDGREITTTNLWCGGDIPSVWQDKFPNNADFDWQWKSIGNNRYLFPKENKG